jgi:hypothetical protein
MLGGRDGMQGMFYGKPPRHARVRYRHLEAVHLLARGADDEQSAPNDEVDGSPRVRAQMCKRSTGAERWDKTLPLALSERRQTWPRTCPALARATALARRCSILTSRAVSSFRRVEARFPTDVDDS